MLKTQSCCDVAGLRIRADPANDATLSFQALVPVVRRSVRFSLCAFLPIPPRRVQFPFFRLFPSSLFSPSSLLFRLCFFLFSSVPSNFASCCSDVCCLHFFRVFLLCVVLFFLFFRLLSFLNPAPPHPPPRLLSLIYFPPLVNEANVVQPCGPPRRRRLLRRPDRQAFAFHVLADPDRNVLQHPVLEVQTPHGGRLRGRLELPLARVGRGRREGELGGLI